MKTATNPQTGERMIEVNGQWVPVEKSATNPDTGEQAFFAGGSWHTPKKQAPKQRTPQPITDEERNRIGREELGNPLEAGLIGAGRFATELGQGVKQKYLMATDPEAAQAYTDKINQERERWETGTKGAGAEDIGYYGAMLAPGAVSGGAGIMGTAGLGALEAGIMPTQNPDWAETGKQAAMGAALAGGMRAAPDLYTAWRRSRKAKAADKVDPDVAAFSGATGTKVPRDIYAPSVASKAAAEIVDYPFIGRAGGKAMREDADRVMQEMSDAAQSADTVQDAFVKGKEALETADSAVWKNTHAAIGDAPIDRSRLNQQMEAIIGSTKSNNIDQTDRLRELWAPVKTRPEFKGQSMDELRDYRQKWDEIESVRGFEGDTLEDLHKFRAKFGAREQRAWREKGWDVSIPKQIYATLTEELRNAAGSKYGKAGVDRFDAAVEGTKEMHRTIDSARLMRSGVQDKIDVDRPFVNAALSNDRARRESMRKVLGEQGAPAVQSEIMQDIMDVYSRDGATSAARRIQRLDGPIKEFFGEDQAAVMRGFSKFLQELPPETRKGQGLRDLFQAGATAGAAVTSPVSTGAVLGGAQAFVRRRDVQAMLQKLSKEPKDSKLYKALTSELAKAAYAGAGAQVAQSPLQIEIQDGRTP